MIARPAEAGFREPRQQRSRHNLQRIVAATESILVERGPEGVTVQDVVDHAGTSVGAFYARFDGKEAVMRYVEDRFWSAAEERWTGYLDPTRWKSVTAAAVVARVVRQLVRLQNDARRPFRAFLLQALSRSDAGLLERTRRLDLHVAVLMSALMVERGAGLTHPDPGRAARDGFLRVIGSARDLAVFGTADEENVREGILALVRMYGAFLDVDGLPQRYGALVRLCAAS